MSDCKSAWGNYEDTMLLRALRSACDDVFFITLLFSESFFGDNSCPHIDSFNDPAS